MPESSPEEWPSPSDFPGNFRAYIGRIQELLEVEYEGDPGEFETVAERAAAEAQFLAAHDWLVERWGERFPCPVCRNVEWTVSQVLPAARPTGFLSFHATCGYCGNTMQVVPGRAEMDAPRLPDQQLHFPEPQ